MAGAGRHWFVEVGQGVVGDVDDLECRVIASSGDVEEPPGDGVGLAAWACAANDDRHPRRH